MDKNEWEKKDPEDVFRNQSYEDDSKSMNEKTVNKKSTDYLTKEERRERMSQRQPIKNKK